MKTLWLPLLLAGCACDPLIVREPVEVQVPVAVPCLTQAPAKPVWALDALALDTVSTFKKVNTALIELEQRRAYERELEAALTACLQEKPKEN